jgi:hypothetical protein
VAGALAVIRGDRLQADNIIHKIIVFFKRKHLSENKKATAF